MYLKIEALETWTSNNPRALERKQTTHRARSPKMTKTKTA
jgi:hypothetical protein